MKTHQIFLFTALIGSLGLTVGCHQRSESKSGLGVVATVGETAIHVSELQAEIDQRKARGQQPEPDRILDELILREAFVARARHLGLHEDPEVISAYKNLLIARLKERELEPQMRGIEVSDQIQPPLSQKDLNPATIAVPQIRLAILRQTIHPTTSVAKIEQLTACLAEARNKAMRLPASESAFGSLAINYSDDQVSRYRGGDLGWLIEDAEKLRYDRSMLEAAFALESPGAISPIIRGHDGVYLVRLLDRRTMEKQNTMRSNTGDGLSYKARLDKQREIEHTFREQVRAKIPIAIYKDNLSKIETLTGDPTPNGSNAF